VRDLREVSLLVAEGELFAVIGPDGAGKVDTVEPDEGTSRRARLDHLAGLAY
jgi:ABC-type uncharacterized transport system ATPase subunit